MLVRLSFDIQFETNKFMKHTIVISLYNTEAFIFDAITSLAFQEKKPSQIIIVDDCSTDKSLFRLKEALKPCRFLLRNFC
jgi:glycosyltransferase involved in cell wall biosynthesis